MPLIHGALKRSILERIRGLGLVDDLGEPVQVEPVFPPETERQCVFAGVTRWAQAERTGERSLVMQQTITVEIRIRVEQPGGDIDEADRIAEQLQAQIATGVCSEPFLLGPNGTLTASSGDSDPTVVAPDPDSKVIVNLGLTFTAVVLTAGV